LGGHLVPENIKSRFSEWPAVKFVSHDRRDAIALDIATFGWARAER
jgi:hypothetical protein